MDRLFLYVIATDLLENVQKLPLNQLTIKIL